MKANVSVVMPYYNSPGTVERSIRSVVGQSMPVAELIIVDDGSDDADALSDIVKKYSDRLSINHVSLGANHGVACARNVGISKAGSKYIAFLDSDDVWHPEKIAIQYQYMEKHAVEITGHGYVFDLSFRDFDLLSACNARKIRRSNFCWGNPFFTPTVMVARESFISFDENHRRVDDYKCWYENFKSGNCWLLTCDLAGGFKPPIGASGLSGSVKLMHESYVAVLSDLYSDKKMGVIFYCNALLIETIKYPIRLFLVNIKKYMERGVY